MHTAVPVCWLPGLKRGSGFELYIFQANSQRTYPHVL
jgi:hypothetical protein